MQLSKSGNIWLSNLPCYVSTLVTEEEDSFCSFLLKPQYTAVHDDSIIRRLWIWLHGRKEGSLVRIDPMGLPGA